LSYKWVNTFNVVVVMCKNWRWNDQC